MPIREKNVTYAARELLKIYPDIFNADYNHNKEVLNTHNLFDQPLSRTMRHKVAGAVSNLVRKYDRANPDWRNEIKTGGHVSSRSGYNVSGGGYGKGPILSQRKKEPRRRKF